MYFRMIQLYDNAHEEETSTYNARGNHDLSNRKVLSSRVFVQPSWTKQPRKTYRIW